MEPTIGEIRLFGGNFAPQNWLFCEGQLLQISQNQALFSILGTQYGGDGRTTFALPDFRGRTAIHTGQGAGLSNRTNGEKVGEVSTTLNLSNLAPHNHIVPPVTFKPLAIDEKDNSSSPSGNHPSKTTNAGNPIYHPETNVEMAAQTVALATSATGSGTSFDNMQPTLAVRYIIAVTGLFPSRS